MASICSVPNDSWPTLSLLFSQRVIIIELTTTSACVDKGCNIALFKAGSSASHGVANASPPCLRLGLAWNMEGVNERKIFLAQDLTSVLHKRDTVQLAGALLRRTGRCQRAHTITTAQPLAMALGGRLGVLGMP